MFFVSVFDLSPANLKDRPQPVVCFASSINQSACYNWSKKTIFIGKLITRLGKENWFYGIFAKKEMKRMKFRLGRPRTIREREKESER